MRAIKENNLALKAATCGDKASKEKKAGGDAKEAGKKIGDEMKKNIEAEVKKDVIKKTAAAGDANAAEKVNKPAAGTTPASALKPKPGAEPELKVPSSKMGKPPTEAAKPETKTAIEAEKKAAEDMAKKGLISQKKVQEIEKKLDEEIAKGKTGDAAKDPALVTKDGGKLDEINKAASGFMDKVKALNGGVDKTISNTCAMQAESIKAINEASTNFKAAVEALNKNTAQRAISDFKEDKDAALKSVQATGKPAEAKQKPTGLPGPEPAAKADAAAAAAPSGPAAGPQTITTTSGRKAVVTNAVVNGNKVEFDAAFEK